MQNSSYEFKINTYTLHNTSLTSLQLKLLPSSRLCPGKWAMASSKFNFMVRFDSMPKSAKEFSLFCPMVDLEWFLIRLRQLAYSQTFLKRRPCCGRPFATLAQSHISIMFLWIFSISPLFCSAPMLGFKMKEFIGKWIKSFLNSVTRFFSFYFKFFGI